VSKILEQLEREEHAAWTRYYHVKESFFCGVFALPEWKALKELEENQKK
jgi:hypothetical protein